MMLASMSSCWAVFLGRWRRAPRLGSCCVRRGVVRRFCEIAFHGAVTNQLVWPWSSPSELCRLLHCLRHVGEGLSWVPRVYVVV